jgi:hypothetical protein
LLLQIVKEKKEITGEGKKERKVDLVLLGFELGALCLPWKHSTTRAMPPVLKIILYVLFNVHISRKWGRGK